MIRRHLIALLAASLALTAVESSWPGVAIAKDGDSGGTAAAAAAVAVAAAVETTAAAEAATTAARERQQWPGRRR